MADNLLTSAALAATCPLIVAPAMNHHMWEHAATQANVATLARARRRRCSSPGTGALARKASGARAGWPSRAELLAAVEAVGPPASGPRDGLRVLVTAGGTREPIDAVRYVGNRSSGRMGFALAERGRRAAARRSRSSRRTSRSRATRA